MATARVESSPLAELARNERWTRPCIAATAVCGIWLIGSPWVFGYPGHPQAISAVVCGAILIALAAIAQLAHRPAVLWGGGVVGAWLVLSPVVLWAPSAAAYANATVLGCLVTVVTFILPISRRTSGGAIPAGWSYNPSSRLQRAPIVVLSAVAFVIALYMAVFQLGFTHSVFDPVFGDGTRRVLTSSVSRSFPVSDAGLGAAMYLIEVGLTCAGDTRRWRTLPWLVLLFGVLIVPGGVVAVTLVMLQPIAVGSWCFWCLLTATATLVMVPHAIDEVAATLQVLRRAHARGQSWTRVLWRGDHEGATDRALPPHLTVRAFPLGLIAVALAGLWSIIEPAALGTSGRLAIATTISGTLAIVVAAVASSEIARPVRMAVVPIAAWTAAAPWVLSGSTPTSHLSGPLAAVIMAAFGLPRGPVRQRRADLDRIAMWPAPASANP